MDEDLRDLIPRAKICLAIDHTLEAGYWSDRAAQYICCGGFVLHRYVPMLESRFNHNIMYFHGVEDCLDQIEFWLDKDEDRELVAAEAYENNAYYNVKEKAANLLEIIQEIL
jgi:spore maturation protein CgeB